MGIMAHYITDAEGNLIKVAGNVINKTKASVGKETYYSGATSNTANETKSIFTGSFTKGDDDTVLLVSFGTPLFKTSYYVGHLRLMIDNAYAGEVITGSTSYTGVSYSGIRTNVGKGEHTYSLRIQADSGAVATIGSYSTIYLTIQEI
jgi:hypothetical protein